MSKAMVNDIQIEYETFGNKNFPALLLIAGLGSQLIYWQEEFCLDIANQGYYVIRFDNRDTGLSSKIDGLTMNELIEKVGMLFVGQDTSVPYGIDDMASDGVALLDYLDIDKAHIAGMSMGGYIAQSLCLNYQDRALSLTSIFSHTGKRNVFLPTQEVMEAMSPPPEDREGYITQMINLFRITFGTGKVFDEDYHRKLAEKSFDRCSCSEGVIRQYLAILSQKDRTEDLKHLNIPALIIHGDEDPMVPLTGGEATAKAIPNSKLKIIKGMGHVMPNLDTYWSDILNEMVNQMAKRTNGN
ncbi:MAG: alpha/beta fold hydrolase [Desulfotignum sp.]|nr:alpha/beta fold hydrolase [Desulfotignum sp.]